MKIKALIDELKRRNVFRVATAYAIAGWLLIQVANVMEDALKLPDWFDGIVVSITLIGFPIALIFAWAFELTPEGLKKSNEVEITESVTSDTGKKINKIIIGSLSVLVLFLLTERIFFAESTILDRDQAEFSQASIAVLPFADLSPEGDQEYFSDGLSEELLNVLAKVGDMKVAGRTSSFKFKGQNENLTLIGSELGVDHILEGSVRKAGNTIRITAQLIKVDDGFHMWSETYDREYTAENIFRIQDEISQMVLNELKVRLLPEDAEDPIVNNEELPTADIEAYEAYLRGTELLRNRRPDEIELAIEQFKKATEIDQGFAQAYAYISYAYARLYEYGSIDKVEVTELIRSYADRALFINPEIPHAYAGLSAVYELKDDTTNTINAAKRAFELNPKDAEMVNTYAVMLSTFEEDYPEYVDKSDSLLLVAYDLDPFHPVIATNAARVYRVQKNLEKAFEVLDKNIETNPEYLSSYTQKIYILRGEGFGKWDEAFIEAYRGYQNNPESLTFMRVLHGSLEYFELDSLEHNLNNEILRLYPNNPVADQVREIFKFQEFNALLDNEEYEEAKAYANENMLEEIGDDIDEFNEWFENAESRALFNNYYEEKDFQNAVDIILEIKPEYLTDTLTTHPEWNGQTMKLRFLFEQVGRQELVDNLNTLEFEFGDWIEFEHNKDISKEDFGEVFALAQESLYNSDIPRYIEIIEEVYFNRKLKDWTWNYEFDEPHEIELIENHPELKDLIDRIQADQQRMKDNVVAFLKEEGVWEVSWESDED